MPAFDNEHHCVHVFAVAIVIVAAVVVIDLVPGRETDDLVFEGPVLLRHQTDFGIAAQESRALADHQGFEIRWLPMACPELNPVDSIWRRLKGIILCNSQPRNVSDTIHTSMSFHRQT